MSFRRELRAASIICGVAEAFTLHGSAPSKTDATDEIPSSASYERRRVTTCYRRIEVTDASYRRRQLFRKSLEDPNENSIAQVERANRKIGGLPIDKELLALPKTLEASAEAVGILAQTVADPGGRVMRALSASISSVSTAARRQLCMIRPQESSRNTKRDMLDLRPNLEHALNICEQTADSMDR